MSRNDQSRRHQRHPREPRAGIRPIGRVAARETHRLHGSRLGDRAGTLLRLRRPPRRFDGLVHAAGGLELLIEHEPRCVAMRPTTTGLEARMNDSISRPPQTAHVDTGRGGLAVKLVGLSGLACCCSSVAHRCGLNRRQPMLHAWCHPSRASQIQTRFTCSFPPPIGVPWMPSRCLRRPVGLRPSSPVWDRRTAARRNRNRSFRVTN